MAGTCSVPKVLFGIQGFRKSSLSILEKRAVRFPAVAVFDVAVAVVVDVVVVVVDDVVVAVFDDFVVVVDRTFPIDQPPTAPRFSFSLQRNEL